MLLNLLHSKVLQTLLVHFLICLRCITNGLLYHCIIANNLFCVTKLQTGFSKVYRFTRYYSNLSFVYKLLVKLNYVQLQSDETELAPSKQYIHSAEKILDHLLNNPQANRVFLREQNLYLKSISYLLIDPVVFVRPLTAFNSPCLRLSKDFYNDACGKKDITLAT